MRALGAAVVALAVLPASASAASLSVDKPCYAAAAERPAREPVSVTGAGFRPNSPVRLAYEDGTYAGQVTADAAGNLAATVEAPMLAGEDKERSLLLSATDPSQPAPLASVPVRVSRLEVVATPARARPHARVTYEARGFPTGRNLYAHYVYPGRRGRVRKTVRLGRLTGPCGTLTRRARLLPVRRVRYGRWYVQWDVRPRFSRRTVPQYHGTLRIGRT